MLTGLGMTISAYFEAFTVMNFILNVDKKKLEFKVINKNSKNDR